MTWSMRSPPPDHGGRAERRAGDSPSAQAPRDSKAGETPRLAVGLELVGRGRRWNPSAEVLVQPGHRRGRHRPRSCTRCTPTVPARVSCCQDQLLHTAEGPPVGEMARGPRVARGWRSSAGTAASPSRGPRPGRGTASSVQVLALRRPPSGGTRRPRRRVGPEVLGGCLPGPALVATHDRIGESRRRRRRSDGLDDPSRGDLVGARMSRGCATAGWMGSTGWWGSAACGVGVEGLGRRTRPRARAPRWRARDVGEVTDAPALRRSSRRHLGDHAPGRRSSGRWHRPSRAAWWSGRRRWRQGVQPQRQVGEQASTEEVGAVLQREVARSVERLVGARPHGPHERPAPGLAQLASDRADGLGGRSASASVSNQPSSIPPCGPTVSPRARPGARRRTPAAPPRRPNRTCA